MHHVLRDASLAHQQLRIHCEKSKGILETQIVPCYSPPDQIYLLPRARPNISENY